MIIDDSDDEKAVDALAAKPPAATSPAPAEKKIAKTFLK